LDKIAAKFEEYKIDGLLLIGGFEAFKSAIQMKNARYKHNEFFIPLVCLPSTINNNVPGINLLKNFITILYNERFFYRY
jgi:6-phosphofructokinase 1